MRLNNLIYAFFIAIIFTVGLFLQKSLPISHFFKQETVLDFRSGLKNIPIKAVSRNELESFLNEGMTQLEKGMQLRQSLKKAKINPHRATHIPELKEFIPAFKSFFTKASQEEPDKEKALNLIFSQFDHVFKNKQMNLKNWIAFHIQALLLFSDPKKSANFKYEEDLNLKYVNDSIEKRLQKSGMAKWGKLDLKKDYLSLIGLQKIIETASFPIPIYTKDGIFGVNTLITGFLNKAVPIPITTNHNFEAHGGSLLSPLSFLQHDAGHYYYFTTSTFLNKKMGSIMKKVLHKIQENSDLFTRAKEMSALFLLIHEIAPFRSEQIESFSEAIDASLTSSLYFFGIKNKISSVLIKQSIVSDLTYQMGKKGFFYYRWNDKKSKLKIQHRGPGQYRIEGKIAPMDYSYKKKKKRCLMRH